MLVLDASVAWKWFFRSRPAEADTGSALLVKADAGYLRKAARDGRIILNPAVTPLPAAMAGA